MDIKVINEDVARVETPALIVNLFEGVTTPGGATGAVDKALDGAISRLIADGEIKGKKGEIRLIHTFGKIPANRVLVLGLGKSDAFDEDSVRRLMAQACRYLRNLGVKQVATIAHGAGIAGMDAESSAQAIAEGSILGLYRFQRHKTKNDNKSDIEELQIVERDTSKTAALQAGAERGSVVAEAACMARDLVNEPANVMTPTRLAEEAVQVAGAHGLEVEVLERDDMRKLGMGVLLGVAQGSHEPPKFIILRYKGDQENPEQDLGLIGKGITFDTGGISIKPSARMEEMKGDMAGAASVIAAAKAVAQLKPRLNVTFIAAATENMPGGSAQRPGDIVKAMDGQTIEVINTDAEGRLVLADAVAYARKQGLSPIVDMATLTGACVIALGNICTGVIGNDQDIVDKVIAAGQKAGEKAWQLPTFDEYKEQYKSNVADMMNVGGRAAGTITGGMIIGEFAGDTPWAHLDIAGTSYTGKESGYQVKGGTGVPVRTLVNLVLGMAHP